MLGVSLYKDKVSYLRTEKSNNSLSVTHHGTEKYQNFNQLISNSVKNIIKNEKIRNEDTISFVIDSQFCSFNEIYCEDSPLLEFHNDLSGNSSFKDYFDSYYYPITSRDDHYLGIHIERGFKQQILNSIDGLDFSIRSIGIGIFSAETLARFVFNAHSLNNYLIIRFITSNSLEVLFINDGLLSVYARYNIVNKKIKVIKVIGNRNDEEKIRLNLEKIIRGKTKINDIEKVFVYQTNGQSPIIKDIIGKKSSNITLLNIFNYNNSDNLNHSVSTTMNQLVFSELGKMFGGLNV